MDSQSVSSREGAVECNAATAARSWNDPRRRWVWARASSERPLSISVPAGPVLVLQQSQTAGGVHPLGPPGVGQVDQGGQAEVLRVIGYQLDEQSGQPAGLVAQVTAHQLGSAGRGVTLGEDQVDHRSDHRDPVGQTLAVRGLDPDSGPADLAAGPGEAAGHRPLGDHEGLGDLGHGETADELQRQSHAGVGSEGRMAARDQQRQAVVHQRCGRGGPLPGPGQGREAGLEAAITTQHVDGPTPGDGDQPTARRGRNALGRPAAGGGLEGLLGAVLGQLQVTEVAGHGGDDPGPLGGEHLGDHPTAVAHRGGSSMRGRTSTDP